MSHTVTSVESTDTVSREEREFYRCPDWCVRTDHPAEEIGVNHPPIHYGPDFGFFWPQAQGDATPVVLVAPDSIEVKRPDVLLKYAQDALAAAEWLNARQAGEPR